MKREAEIPRRVLVIGGGGREHALAWRLAGEPGLDGVWVAPGSDAIADVAGVRCRPEVAALDPGAIVGLAREVGIDLVVVGPEAPLAAGLADALAAAGVAVFGPTGAAARIETSKAFCREVAAAAGVRMAKGGAFAEFEPARALAAELCATLGGVVVKADGLAAGKGVTVCEDLATAEDALEALFDTRLEGSGAGRAERSARGAAARTAEIPKVVVEERLVGREASLIALCDGRRAVALPPARDHKRLLDDDLGPNTGGMGAYSPLPDLPDSAAEALLEAMHRPVLAELARRGTPFRGALYAGLMLTAGGPVLLEFNARFGDPETQAILPRLAVPMGSLLLAAAKGRLDVAWPSAGPTVLPSGSGAAVAIVLAAAGYPGAPRAGDPIDGLEAAERAGALVFHAGTARDRDGRYRTRGGRVLAVVGQGDDLPSARATAERAAGEISFAGLQRRHDIAARWPSGASEDPVSRGLAATRSGR